MYTKLYRSEEMLLINCEKNISNGYMIVLSVIRTN